MRALVLVIVGALLLGPKGQAQVTAPTAVRRDWLTLPVPQDVAAELAIRRAARDIAQGRDPERNAQGGQTAWVVEEERLEAYARAGVYLDDATVGADVEDRAELAAAKLRVLAGSRGDFFPRMDAALRSPFRGLQEAAIERLAAASVEPPGRTSCDRSRLHGFLASAVAAPELPLEGRRRLLGIALQTGGDGAASGSDGRRLDRLLVGEVARGVAAGRDRGEGWEPALAFFEEIVAVPVTADEIERLASITGAKEALAPVALVAGRRDQSSAKQTPYVGAAKLLAASDPAWSRLGSYELDVLAESLVEALDARGLDGGPGHGLGRGTERFRNCALGFMYAAVGEGVEEDGYLRCLRAASSMGSVATVLAQSLASDPALSEAGQLEVWDALDRRASWQRRGPVSEFLAYVTHPVDDVREAAIRAIGRRFAHEGYLGYERFVRQALRDPNPAMRSFAFSWLVNGPEGEAPSEAPPRLFQGPPSLQDALRGAFDREGEGQLPGRLSERQGRWLAQLPRDRTPVLFRDVLLDVLSVSGTSSEAMGASSLELLGTFQGDAEIFERVKLLLERSLVGLEAADGYLARLPFDSEAARAARILHGIDGDGAVALLDGALGRSMDLMHGEDALGDARPQLPKTAAGLLARSQAGRRALRSYLNDTAPRRVRFEAALQLARLDVQAGEGGSGGRCASILVRDYRGVDGALRLRAIRALGRAGLMGEGVDVDGFLGGLSRSVGEHAERIAAIDALGTRRSIGGLLDVLDFALGTPGVDAATIDAAAAAARALRYAAGTTGEASTRLALEARLLGESLIAVERGDFATVRGGLLESAAALSLGLSTPTNSLRDILRVPLEEAEETVTRSFGTHRRIEPQFLWSSELAALQTLGAAPGAAEERSLFRQAIGIYEAWGRLDGRLLLAMGRVAYAAGVKDLAADLGLAATHALPGEGRSQDLVRRLAEARWFHGTVALEVGRVEEAARSWAGLLGSYAAGEPSRSVLRAMLPDLKRPEVEARVRYLGALARLRNRGAIQESLGAWEALLPEEAGG